MRIFGGHDGGSGCAWYRVILPFAELAKHGYETTAVSSSKRDGGKGATRQAMAGHDVIVAQKWDNHAGLGVWRRQALRSKLVYELDDDMFSIEPVNFASWQQFSRPEVRDAVVHAAQTADLVTVSTEPLAEVMREYAANVAVLPNHIPGWVLDLPAPAGERPAVGWHGGASHGTDIRLIGRPVREFLNRHPGWDAVMIGADYRTAVRHERCGYVPWVHVTDAPEAFYTAIDWDIGLAPLQLNVFNRSKSHIKALEYAARGIPVIASDAEPYNRFVLHGVTGFLVRQDHEWLKYLEELAGDEGLRRSMGAKAKEQARAWTIEQGWKLWADAYEGLMVR